MDGDELRRLSKERRTLIDALARGRGRARPRPGLRAADARDAGGEPDPAGRPQRPRARRAGHRRPGCTRRRATAVSARMIWRPRSPRRCRRSRRPQSEGAAESEKAADERGRPQRPKSAAADAARKAPTPPGPRRRRPPTVADAATAKADELADQVESLRADLRAEENREREAREEARAARKRLTELTRVAAAAEDDARAAEARRRSGLIDLVHSSGSGLISTTRWSSSADPRRAAGSTIPAVSSTRPDISSASSGGRPGGGHGLGLRRPGADHLEPIGRGRVQTVQPDPADRRPLQPGEARTAPRPCRRPPPRAR